MLPETTITRVSRIAARFEAREWDWATRHQDAIAENWRRRQAKTPQIFNGRVLVLSDLSLTNGRCDNTYFEVDYASFIAWIDLGYPDRQIANGFAMGALQGSDGAFICGIMSNHTANAGRVYFPAGTPDLSDLRADGTVDLAGSLTRELIEETGLTESEFTVSDDWIVVQQWPVVSLIRTVRLSVPADEGAKQIEAILAGQAEPELQGLKIVRGSEDIDPQTMPLYLQSFFEWAFAQR